jgi:hypothetical protein
MIYITILFVLISTIMYISNRKEGVLLLLSFFFPFLTDCLLGE